MYQMNYSLKELPATYGPQKGQSILERYLSLDEDGNRDISSNDLINSLQEGLDMKEFEKLQDRLAIPAEKLYPLLGLAKATVHRRKAEGKLKPDESDRVIRFARLFGMAVEVFHDLEYARTWLKHPQRGLGGAIPLEYARTEVGAREVEDLMGRIEHGVYS